MLKELLFISSLGLFIGIIEMDYTSTPATSLDDGKTTTQEHERCVITFLTDVLGDEFNIIRTENGEDTSIEED